MVEFGFGVMKLVKVVAFNSAANHASVGVLRRCGFKEEVNVGGSLTFSVGLDVWFAAKGPVG